MGKTGRKWEEPKMTDVTVLPETFGDCQSGSTDTNPGTCHNGEVTSASKSCLTGNKPGGSSCANGNSTGGACTVGANPG